jgi:ferrous iron transport protein A
MSATIIPLDQALLAVHYSVHELSYSAASAGWPQRLEELGFLPGERVSVLKHGPTGEPLAVRVGHATYALRRAEAACVLVRPWPQT